MQIRSAGLAAGVLSVLAFAQPATAAPVTVDLRIEGPTKTVFEGPVTTDVRKFRFTGGAQEYTCDGTSANGGPSATPVPTGGAAVAAASAQAPYAMKGSWFDGFGPSFTEIGGENVEYDGASGAYLAEYLNGQSTNYGICGQPVQDGDDVLLAYGAFDQKLLALTGPATAAPGATVELTVTDGAQPVSGATVGGQTTGADGKARVTVSQRGPNAFKATKPGAARSNRREVCATDGQDGFCGTTAPGQPADPGSDPGPTPQDGTSQQGGTAPPSGGVAGDTARGRDRSAPIGRVLGIATGARFTTGSAPRELGFSATDPSGIQMVKLRLTRRSGGRCSYFSGSKERFVRSRCGRSFAFKASDRGDFSFLLPDALAAGRYVLDVVAIDRAFNRDQLARGRNRVVFTVR